MLCRLFIIGQATCSHGESAYIPSFPVCTPHVDATVMPYDCNDHRYTIELDRASVMSAVSDSWHNRVSIVPIIMINPTFILGVGTTWKLAVRRIPPGWSSTGSNIYIATRHYHYRNRLPANIYAEPDGCKFSYVWNTPAAPWKIL